MGGELLYCNPINSNPITPFHKVLLSYDMAVSILYPFWKIQWKSTQGPPRHFGILLQQRLAEQGCLAVKNTKKRQLNQQKNNPKRGGAKRRPFLDDLCRWTLSCLFRHRNKIDTAISESMLKKSARRGRRFAPPLGMVFISIQHTGVGTNLDNHHKHTTQTGSVKHTHSLHII